MDFDVVRPVQRFRLDARDVSALRDMEMFLAPVVLGKTARRSTPLGFAGNASRCSGTLTSIPCRKLPTEGTKIGRAVEAGIKLNFRHVLVLEPKPVEFERGRFARLVGLDHRFAAARIAADGGNRDRAVLGHDAASTSGRRSAIAPVA